MSRCKHWAPIMPILLEYCQCLYNLEGCGAGSNLHILLDDDNYSDKDILFCMKECIQQPEAPESKIGILICEEFLKLTLEERCLFLNMFNGQSCDCSKFVCDDCITNEVIDDGYID